jgi:hypothetical protein
MADQPAIVPPVVHSSMSDHTNFTLAFKPLEKLIFDGTPEYARKILKSFGLACGSILLNIHPQHGGSEILYGEPYMTSKVANYVTLEAKCAAAGAAAQTAMRHQIATASTMLCQIMVLTLDKKISIYSSEIDILTGENTIKTLSSVFLRLQSEFITDSPSVQHDLDQRINSPLTARNFPEMQQQLSDKKVAIRQSQATGNALPADRMYRAFKSNLTTFGVHFTQVVDFYENDVEVKDRTVTALIDKLLKWAVENTETANSGFAHYIARDNLQLSDGNDGTANKVDGAVKGPKATTLSTTWDLSKAIRTHGDTKHKETHAPGTKFCIIHGWNTTHATHPSNGVDGCMVLSRERRSKKP